MLLVTLALAGPVYDRISTDHRLIWAGIDYRAVEMYVPETFADPEETVHWDPGGGLFDYTGHFASPKDAWMRLCGDWNTMFQTESVARMERSLKVPVVAEVPDLCRKAKRDPWFTPDYEAERHPSTFTREQIPAIVKEISVKSSTGLAMVVIAERFARTEGRACVWPTFFDVATKEVLHTKQYCEPPTGIGFRNYWYNPVLSAVKEVLRELKDHTI